MKFKFNLKSSVAKECIVYLDYLKKINEGIYDIYVDFRKHKDLLLFQNLLGNIDLNSTYIELKSIKTSKRLRRGCYYKLNLALLSNVEYEDVEDSFIIGRRYNMNQMRTPSSENSELLQTHSLLDASEMKHNNVNEGLLIPTLNSCGNKKIIIRDVDQANWNEIIEDDIIKIIFDLGARLHASKAEVEKIFNARQSLLLKSKPMLVISHWDMDHIHCLKYLSDVEISQYFSSFICVNHMKSITAENVYLKVLKGLGNNKVCCLNNPVRSNGTNMHFWKRSNNVSFYLGEKSSNINFTGICMFIKGRNKSVNFTGDVKLKQAKNAYDQELQRGMLTNEHILIAPHHGGDYGARVRTYSTPCTQVIISVGINNNYGHPDRLMYNFLNRLSVNNVIETSNSGDICESI